MTAACCLSGACDRPSIRPRNQLLKVVGRNGTDIYDSDPVKSGHVPGRFDAGYVGKLQEALRGCANAETPHFRFAGLEIRKLPAARIVDEYVAGFSEQF